MNPGSRNERGSGKKNTGRSRHSGHHQVMKKQGHKTSGTSKSKKHTPSSGVALPQALDELIMAYCREKTGKGPDDRIVLDRLRQAVMAQKAMYWRDKPGKSVKYGRGYDILAYLAYHLPVYFIQFRSLLQDLMTEHTLPDQVTLLDIGTGPGVVPLAMADIWKTAGTGNLQVYAVERSEEHAEAYRFLLSGYTKTSPAITIHPVILQDLTRVQDIRPHLPDTATLITFQNVIAEFEHFNIQKKAELVLSYAEILDDQGFILLVEPAELRHATGLRLLQMELVRHGLYVYAPCTYLWGSRCDPSSCWTFREDPPIRPTQLMTLLAGDEEGYRFMNTDLKYAYLILSKRPISRSQYRVPLKNRYVRLSQLERYQGRMVSVVAARMSGDIGNSGMHIFKLCDGSCREPVYLVVSARSRRPGHSAIFQSSYGEPLIITGVQVKRHPRHPAWNLVASSETRIERVPSPDIPAPVVRSSSKKEDHT